MKYGWIRTGRFNECEKRVEGSLAYKIDFSEYLIVTICYSAICGCRTLLFMLPHSRAVVISHAKWINVMRTWVSDCQSGSKFGKNCFATHTKYEFVFILFLLNAPPYHNHKVSSEKFKLWVIEKLHARYPNIRHSAYAASFGSGQFNCKLYFHLIIIDIAHER